MFTTSTSCSSGAPRHQRSLDFGAGHRLSLESAIATFRSLPYKNGGMASRSWGHPRHSVCSFPSKMKPALAATLVSLFTEKGGVVLDPFSGSGTVPFEAALQGRRALATDISTLGHVISSAKICPPSSKAGWAMLNALEDAVSSNWRIVDPSEMESEILDFYHERTAAEILAARRFLRKVTAEFQKDEAGLFLAACMVHLLHGNRPYALSRRSHNIIPIPPKGPRHYKSVIGALRDKVSRVFASSLSADFIDGQSLQCSADRLPFAEQSVDAIITSPPFLGTTDFLRQNRIRLWFLGWDYSVQAAHKRDFLEHDYHPDRFRSILRELHRVARPGCVVVFHVGFVKKFSMTEFLAPLFEESGFTEAGRVREDTSDLESHGRTDRGGTHTHEFLILKSS